MDDKNLMENILLLEKGVCDLYMHGAIESSTANVHQAFNNALNESLCIQDTPLLQRHSASPHFFSKGFRRFCPVR